MVFLTFGEIFDIVLMTLIIGFMFKDFFKSPKQYTDPLDYYRSKKNKSFLSKYFNSETLEDMKFSMMVVAPAIIFHEFGHKIVAMLFGLNATFHAAYSWLFFGLILKYLLGFVFVVPAFISVSGTAVPFLGISNINVISVLISFAGPLVNATIYLVMLYLEKNKLVHRKHNKLLILTKRINGFLFIFNMLPIPGFDGFKVYAGLIELIKGFLM